MTKTLIAVVGPTAVGKTALGIQLAQRFAGEVVSGDAMQVYKRMDIGTAKVRFEEMHGVPHHLIDVLEPSESWTVASFQEKARAVIDDIRERGKRPILVGGTGLYVQAITHALDFNEASSDPDFRARMEAYAKAHGEAALHACLAEQDMAAAQRIHPNNSRRVIRALEVIHVTGKPYSAQEQAPATERVIMIGLTMARERLYERINKRVDEMMTAGLLEEVRQLHEEGIRGQSIQAIGYKELYQYLDGEVSLAEAVAQLKQNSRRYAKRQLTWFRNRSEAVWFHMDEDEPARVFEKIFAFIEGKLSYEHE
ncbi:tRNA (adenosine(37)-N6)-dimethylallyltransferase MiaA [Shouchella lonarensis]|uniref:tRNA dimethylallyltransferase n=1 Tax=Shouchella lonarensis TaxID=1464122 RepID=A0A1G6HFE0_9BACI|nr:tRNA (adenosine(37)-N6)-dimethylallyltransferase MiaA [Shouchella lonarensis]SDB92962.1 tRNA dimethylallyltransferase [Shouchella lonarensis]